MVFFERFNLPAFSQGFSDKLVLLALVFFMSDVPPPIAPKAGRQLHPVWALFERDDSSPNNVKATCLGCKEWRKQGQPPRMICHAKTCRKAATLPNYAEVMERVADFSRGVSSLPSSSSPAHPACDLGEPEDEPSKKKLKQGPLNFVRTPPSTAAELDMAVARFVVASDSPFSIVENPLFLRMVQQLRPGYRPPNRHQISCELVDRMFDEEVDKVRLRV